MSSDPTCAKMSEELSCQRQYELAKILADQQTEKMRYMLVNPACTRFTQLADRAQEHNLQLGWCGMNRNNANNCYCRVMRQVSILDYPQHCLKDFKQ